ncbi:hypothetical protein [Archangium sp.]|uniref:hypothetical protein n=1 Tax=Archangium sp. TaxID=1872627 RepID=UPI00286A3C4D|nr:hypothetical protein [Archangium sp.]
MSVDWKEGLEVLLTIVATALSSAAAVRRFMGGPLGEAMKAALGEAMKAALGELLAKALEAERPKLLEQLRSELAAMVRQETESLRERMARVEGLLGLPLPAPATAEKSLPSPVVALANVLTVSKESGHGG